MPSLMRSDQVTPLLARQASAWALVLLLAGCAVDVVSSQNPFASIPDRSVAIRVGQMGREAVRGHLGEPVLSSLYWQFDLYRADTSQSNVAVAVTPWPVPFARITDQLHRYTLVAYGANGLVDAVASGLFRKPTAWRNVSPIRTDFPALHLRAADTLFFVDPEGARDVNMLVAPAGRDRFLRHPGAGGDCLAVLGCGDRACGDQLSVDASAVRRLPLRNAHAYWFKDSERPGWLRDVDPHSGDARVPWLETLVAISLGPGDHILEFSAKHMGGLHSMKFACHPGEVSYLTIWAVDNGRFMKRALVDWAIDRTEVMPTQFARRPLVLMDDGKWYVDAEPGDKRRR